MQSSQTVKSERKRNHVQPNKEINRKKDNRKIWFFCDGGCGWQYPTFDAKCPICGRKYVRQATYEAIVKRFVTIYEENRQVIDKHLKLQIDIQNDFKIPVQLGKFGFYFVPLKHFVQLANLERTDHSQYAIFIEYLIQHCKQAKL